MTPSALVSPILIFYLRLANTSGRASPSPTFVKHFVDANAATISSTQICGHSMTVMALTSRWTPQDSILSLHAWKTQSTEALARLIGAGYSTHAEVAIAFFLPLARAFTGVPSEH
jgi:hypothetical protein